MKRVLAIVCFFSCLLISLNSNAWNALGHMVIANIAYENLHPDTQHKVDQMIHDLNQEYPEVQSFLAAAPWPDTLRKQKIETFTRWHYINMAFSTDGTPLKNLIDADNVVWAINTITPIVKNERANVLERARFLAFLVHLVGDLHQPLHAVSSVSAKHPDGDRGGNLYFIRYKIGNADTVCLHRLWDSGVGIFQMEATTENVEALTKTITALYPEKIFGDQVNDEQPEDWVKEDLIDAKNNVYVTPENGTPSQDYIENGKRVSERQVALAGYRLAHLLNQLLVTNTF